MRVDPVVIARVIKSYNLNGIQYLDQETGLLSRSPLKIHAARYIYQPEVYICSLSHSHNLTSSKGRPHKFLHISHILKHLSEMGLEHLNRDFLLHLLNEQSEDNTLAHIYLLDGMDRWWTNCLRTRRSAK